MKPFYRASLSLLPFVFLLAAFSAVSGTAQQSFEGGSSGAYVGANELGCRLHSSGDFCVNWGEGDWPLGTRNGYIYEWFSLYAGRIAGPDDHPWAADTVSAGNFPASLPRHFPLTGIWDSTHPEDQVAWPSAGFHPLFPDLSGVVDDETLYPAWALGEPAVSEQDTWQAYWDGVPSSDEHPGGLRFDVRTLAWNYPRGNESNIYFVFRLTNVSANPEFQRLQEERYFGGADSLPDEGWTLTDLHFGLLADPDVTLDARLNFTSAIVPFAMGMAYRSDFLAPQFDFVPHIFYPPFLERAPGLVGFQFVRSPASPPATANGLAIMSAVAEGVALPYPASGAQLLRYLAGDLRPELQDPHCRVDDPRQRHLCSLQWSAADSRFFQSTGPFELAPGESETVVVVVSVAATVDVPGIEPGVHHPPQLTSTEPSPHPGCFGHEITTLERAAGWLETLSCPPREWLALETDDVRTVPQSLLRRAQVARTLVEHRFLLPRAPAPPPFQTTPTPDGVRITWQPSASDSAGDAFAALATDPASPLHDPNFRAQDVEGYRIYRSTDTENWTLLAQFDREDTRLVDHLCVTDPEYRIGEPCADTTVVELKGRVVQYPPGGVVRTAQGAALPLRADTAAAGSPPLGDTGIPWVHVDSTARPGFQYFYRVTAFDVNSLISGPSSMESESELRSVVPQPLDVVAGALDRIRVAPDPYYGGSTYDRGPAERRLRFFNLPPRATIRIYTVSGVLVDVIQHDGPEGESVSTWELTNYTDLMVASGVYLYHVTTPEGDEHTGRFTVITGGWPM